MKTPILCLAIALALSCAGAAMAADNSSKVTVVRDYTDIVAPSDQAAYEAGIKSFNQCLSQHGFKYTWTAWTHETGDTYAYSYVTDPLPWAAFDAMHTAGKRATRPSAVTSIRTLRAKPARSSRHFPS